MNETFLETAIERLRVFLEKNNQASEIEVLTPDASTREYFRIEWSGKPAIACVYEEPFEAAEHSYLDVTALFLASDLPVANVYTFDGQLGIVIQEDFGNTILRDYLKDCDDLTRNDLLNQAISLIAKIQTVTQKAFDANSIASRLKFDAEKLVWELNYFKIHYFEAFRRTKLSEADDKALTEEFTELAEELAARAEVLCHRDFHAANLMIDKENQLRIIDHQDARIGAASYDLVSLLLDRVTQTPGAEWINEKQKYFLNERNALGLKAVDAAEFANEFNLQIIQRCLKAVGTFSFQSVNRGKTYFVPFIAPALQIALQAARDSGKFPHLQRILRRETDENANQKI